MSREQDVVAIRRLAEQWHTGWAAADTDALAALFTDTPIVILRREPAVVLGRREVRAFFRSAFDHDRHGLGDRARGTTGRGIVVDDSIEIQGGWASCQSGLVLCAAPGNESKHLDSPRTTAVFILKRHAGGGWCIASLLA